MTNLPFRGLNALLAQIRRLVDRPRWRLRRKPGEIRGDRPLPFLCLIRGTADWNVLANLKEWLGHAEPRKVQVALVDVNKALARAEQRWAGADRDRPLLPLLDELVHQLAADKFSAKSTGFRHYRLVDWITGYRVDPVRNPHGKVDTILHDWFSADDRARARQETGLAEAVSQSWWVQVVTTLLFAWHRPLRFLLWSHGVWPFGAVPRWLMRQPFMVPGHSTSFAGFAERLTARRREEENRDQLHKLLVHAFLADLRAAYRPLGPWPSRWRRTSYVVVLLEGVTEDNGGWELLRLINDVRNESAEHDPVLVVATADAVPGDLRLRGKKVPPVSEAKHEVSRWYHELPGRRQSLRDDARFIFFQLPGDHETLPEADECAWLEQRVSPRRPPLLASRLVLATGLVVLLGGSAALGGQWLVARWQHDCLPWRGGGAAVMWLADVGACVGYSDNASQVFGSDPRLVAGQRAVFEQNEIARRLHEENPSRPMVSLVYFADLTHSIADAGTDASLSEELEGLLLRQRQQNYREKDSPLLRVVVANGSDRMTAARTVVDRLLKPMIEADETVLGVFGMALTVPATESAIGALGDLGVPVLASTLTGTALPERSPLYFQIVPGNRVQAELVASYAKWAGAPVTMYHPPLTDNYLSTLVGETTKALGGHPHQTRPWTQQAAELDVECGRGKLAFYVGRENDFPAFLREVVNDCGVDRPTVLGSDTVSRFIAQADARRRDSFNEVAVSYVSMGTRIVLAGRSCRTESRPEAAAGNGAVVTQQLNEFCAGYRSFREPGGVPPEQEATAAFAREATKGEHLPWPGERIGLAYDAGGVFLAAVRNNRLRVRVPDPRDGGGTPPAAPHRAAIAQELQLLNRFEGASGPLNFRESRTGETRPAAILELSNVYRLDEVPTCRFSITRPADQGRPGC